MNEDFIILDEEIILPELKKAEFRLYYSEDGSIMYYTTEDLPGNYIVVSSDVYAEGRHDVRVENGEVVSMANKVIVLKMQESKNGIKCASEDINILVSDDYDGDITQWELKKYEF